MFVSILKNEIEWTIISLYCPLNYFRMLKLRRKMLKLRRKKKKSINNYTIKPDIMFMDINFGSYEVFGL